MTDLTKWHLTVDEGRQVWTFNEDPSFKQTAVDKYFLGLNTDAEIPPSAPALTPMDALRKGIKFFSEIQTEDGHWADDYGGPMFLLPGLVITCYITGTELSAPHRVEMIRYLQTRQNQDGGWGLHIEDSSTIFGTSLSYITLRLLGASADEPYIVKARNFLHAHGGAKGSPTWGKVWMACLGVYDWKGVNPIPPELWLLPYAIPFHPGRWWCHCRVVYLPMGYLYGRKAVGPQTDLVRALRRELYKEDYNTINWNAQRNNVNDLDRYIDRSPLLTLGFEMLSYYESFHSSYLRNKALDLCIDHIRSEDENTQWICIGPVNKCFNMLSIWFAEGDSENFRKHQERIPDYLWLAADGMKMQGYNGCQLWDTAFCAQAMCEAPRVLVDEFKDTLVRAYEFIDLTQVPVDVENKEYYYRHISKGAWPFSTRDHGWPIADCTGEGLTAALRILDTGFVQPLDDQRYYDAVNVILSLQNTDGGWATYENKRGPDFVEWINPAEVFYGIMVDYSYTELTSSSMKGLQQFAKRYPEHRSEEISKSTQRGINFIKRQQKPDGSWYGSWAVCFTYGTWFAVEALVAQGEPLTSPYIQKAVKYLLSIQFEDGGWGESFQSCVQKKYVPHAESQVVNTAWALMTLMAAKCEDHKAIERGIKLLISRQLPNGDWKQEGISGVFNANCAISYSSYKNYFSFWALARYASLYPNKKLF